MENKVIGKNKYCTREARARIVTIIWPRDDVNKRSKILSS